VNLGRLRTSSFAEPVFPRKGSWMFCPVCGGPMATVENGDTSEKKTKEEKGHEYPEGGCGDAALCSIEASITVG